MATQPEEQPAVRPRATWRMGPRERTRLQWAAVAVICILLGIGLKPSFDNLVNTKNFTTCQTNVRSISRAMWMYAQEWDDTLPPAPTWMANVSGNMAATSNTGFSLEKYFKCPDDHKPGVTSYAYNDLCTGLRLNVASSDARAEARRAALGRVDRAPVVIERHGGESSAHLPLANWSDVGRAMTTPHDLPEPTGSMIRGNGGVSRVTREELATLAGRRF